MKIEKHFFSRQIKNVDGMPIKRHFCSKKIKAIGPMKVNRGWWGKVTFEPLIPGYSQKELASIVRKDDRLIYHQYQQE